VMSAAALTAALTVSVFEPLMLIAGRPSAYIGAERVGLVAAKVPPLGPTFTAPLRMRLARRS
jgi:hypothetical protein